MATLSLKISIENGKVVKTIQFDPSSTVYDACRIIREKILEANINDAKEYGLFLASEEDNKKGIWLESSRSLDYYMLRNGDVLEYNKKTRNLRVRMLDGTVKTLLVDDSQVVANLMVVICTKIGITNYDEYGLVREEQKEECDPCEKPNYGTLTLRRKHHEKERDAKMEQLRKKLRTDDEVNWVEPSKTLREQGIDVTETLLLRRKLFFSDRNVDSRDPVQLNLLYVQARDAILDGTHPITQDKACEFAGIQCQIQFGDHKEDKHTTGFLDLKEFLPASYVKVKGIEKKVFKEHRRHVNLSELDAKVLYTKSARDLPTYGVAFFLVKEKMKGKNKLVPRLLGVTKDSVLRLDEKTKEILQTWPLTTVRRWCASPNTFTLDFGDYSDQYYSVQTTEAEQILQVIAGYIDIIVRKRRARDHLGIEGDEGSAMLEDSVSPSKANIIQHDTFKSGKVNTESVAKPAVLRPGAEGAKPFAVGHMTGAQQTTVSGQAITGHTPPAASQVQQTRITSILSEPQRALLSTITSGREVIKQTEERLTRAALPALGSDAGSIRWKTSTLDSSKQVVTSHIAAMNAATAQVVTLTAGPTEEVDHTAVGAAITTITTNLPEMTKGVQMIAALMEDDSGDSLLDATRKLCSAFTDLLRAAEPETKEPRQNLLNAASRVGEASTSVLHTIGEETAHDKETQVFNKAKKPFLYRKLNYCYENFYRVFFRDRHEYGSDFGKCNDVGNNDVDKSNDNVRVGNNDMGKGNDNVRVGNNDMDKVCAGNNDVGKFIDNVFAGNNDLMQFDVNVSRVNDKYVDDGIYEDVNVNDWGKLDVIQEESDSDYYRSVDYCNVNENNTNNVNENNTNNVNENNTNNVNENNTNNVNESNTNNVNENNTNNVNESNTNHVNDIVDSCNDYLNNGDATNAIGLNNSDVRKTKSQILREQFFANGERGRVKNDFKNSVTNGVKTGVENGVKSDFKNGVKKYTLNDFKNCVTNDAKNGVKNDIKSCVTNDAKTGVENDMKNGVKNDAKTGVENGVRGVDLSKYNRALTTTGTFTEIAESRLTNRGERNYETLIKQSEKYCNECRVGTTEIRIVYNPTFDRRYCSFCKRTCARADIKCCTKCVCLENQLKRVFNDNWLNIIMMFALLLVVFAVFIQWFLYVIGCEFNWNDCR